MIELVDKAELADSMMIDHRQSVAEQRNLFRINQDFRSPTFAHSAAVDLEVNCSINLLNADRRGGDFQR